MKGTNLLDFDNSSGEPNFDIIQRDVPPIASLLKDHSSVILSIQAGFLGNAWGEWWGTPTTPDNDVGTDTYIRQVKTFVVDTLLTTGVSVPVRTPSNVANYYNGHALVGWHNDCILSGGFDGHDTGTFDKPSAIWPAGSLEVAKTFAQKEIKGIVGGESCPGSYVATCEDLLKYVQVRVLNSASNIRCTNYHT